MQLVNKKFHFSFIYYVSSAPLLLDRWIQISNQQNDVVKGSNIKTSNMHENYKQGNTCFVKWPVPVLAVLIVVSPERNSLPIWFHKQIDFEINEVLSLELLYGDSRLVHSLLNMTPKYYQS